MQVAEASNKSGDELQAVEDEWVAQAGLKLFDEVVVDAIRAGSYRNKDALVRQYKSRVKGHGNAFARRVAREMLHTDVYFDWEAPRTREGFYRYKGGCQCAITRAVAYAPYADCIWMESKLPDYAQAKEFADGVHAVWPQQK
jgi:isocitrate lyase